MLFLDYGTAERNRSADGQSKPNVAGTIVSGMEGGVDPANGLTKEGLEQARRAGRELKEVMLQAGCSPANTMVWKMYSILVFLFYHSPVFQHLVLYCSQCVC